MAAYIKAIRENPMLTANTHKASNTIYGIWSPKNGSAFAAAENGIVFEYNGKEIITHKTTPEIDFYDIYGFAPDDVWTVGTFGKIWRYYKNKWIEIKSPTEEWLE